MLVEHIVASEQVVHCHEGHWVDIAVGSHEGAEILVCLVTFVQVIEFHNVEVLFSMEKLVGEVTHQASILNVVGFAPSRVVVLKPVRCDLEWTVVNQRQQVGLLVELCHDCLPEGFVGASTEQKVVNGVKQTWVIELIGDLAQMALESLMELGVTGTTDAVGVHKVG